MTDQAANEPRRLRQVTNDVEALYSLIGDTNERVQRIETTVDGHTVQLAEHSKQLATHSKQLATLQATVDGHTAQLAEHSKKLDGHTVQLESLTTEVGGLRTDVRQIIEILTK